jgi:hypothetical protein
MYEETSLDAEEQLANVDTIVEELHGELESRYGPMPVSYSIEVNEHGVLTVSLSHEVREYDDGTVRFGYVEPEERGYTYEDTWNISITYCSRWNNRFGVKIRAEKDHLDIFDDLVSTPDGSVECTKEVWW